MSPKACARAAGLAIERRGLPAVQLWQAGGGGLRAGDVVTTGVVTRFIYVEAEDEVLADFGTQGEVRLRFAR
ncbi:MAG: hypothetical protein ACE5KF_03355 [Kiloniellaceae bacterium]